MGKQESSDLNVDLGTEQDSRDRRLPWVLGCIFGAIHIILYVLIIRAGYEETENLMALLFIEFPIVLVLDMIPGIEEMVDPLGDVVGFFLLGIAGTLFYFACGFLLGKTVVAIRRWARKRHQIGICKSCGYNLTGNVSGKCLECGAQISETENLQDKAVSNLSR